MAGLSNYGKNKSLDALFRAQGIPWQTNGFFVGLFTTTPTGPADAGTEVTGGAYARVALADSLAAFTGTDGGAAASSGTTGTIQNAAAITFAQATASWGTIAGFGLFDASTGGNLVAYGPLSASVAVGQNTTASFAAGQLSIPIGEG